MKKFREFINKNRLVTATIASLIILLSSLFMASQLSGCQYYTDSAGQETVKLTDEATSVLDKASDLAPTVTDALIGVGVAVPALAGVLGIIAGAIGAFTGAYKKYRPQITREHNTAEMYGSLTKALVYAIEQYKLSNGQSWDDLKGKIRKEFADKVGPEALAIIEALLKAYHNNELE